MWYTVGMSAVAAALVWIEPEQVEFVRAACEQAGITIVRAGTPAPGKTLDVASALGAEPIDDLRGALGRTVSELVLLGTSNGIDDGGEGGECGALLELADRAVPVGSIEPLPASILDVQHPDLGAGDESMGVALGPEPGEPNTGELGEEWAMFMPRARLAKSVRDAAEVIAQLGALSMVSVQAFSGPGQGSLGARLYDAMELVSWLLGQPDRIDAAFVSAQAARGRAVHALPGDSLRGLEGDLSANMRFADGRAASIVASSRAGRWNRGMMLVGERGRVRIYDDGWEWVGPDGRVNDSSRDAARVRGSAAAEGPMAPAVRALADQLVLLADTDRAPMPPTHVLAALACCGAALLSARTGEGESPDTILRMARAS